MGVPTVRGRGGSGEAAQGLAAGGPSNTDRCCGGRLRASGTDAGLHRPQRHRAPPRAAPRRLSADPQRQCGAGGSGRTRGRREGRREARLRPLRGGGRGSRAGQRLTWRREAGLTFRALRQAGGSATAARRAASHQSQTSTERRGVVTAGRAPAGFPLKGTQRFAACVGGVRASTGRLEGKNQK